MDYKLFWLITISLWLILNTLHIHDLVVYKKYIANLLTFHKVTTDKPEEKHSKNIPRSVTGGVNSRDPDDDEKKLIDKSFQMIKKMNYGLIKGTYFKLINFTSQVVAGMNYSFSLKTNANEVIDISLFVALNHDTRITSATLTKSDGTVVKITNLPKRPAAEEAAFKAAEEATRKAAEEATRKAGRKADISRSINGLGDLSSTAW
jgi:hypothetical protein